MIYTSILAMIGLVVGLVAVASNPSPYFAAFGLVVSSVCSCWMLAEFGVSFLSLVLLLIYLGGMLVVFAYSASLAAEPYPEAWGSWSVLIYTCFYLVMLIGGYFLFECSGDVKFLFSGLSLGFGIIVSDWGGVGDMYLSANVFLIISGWVLLLTLFVVLEITRGMKRGALRAV
uniref:NADH-ubiquinone oxidoreductase chain 6 n=1 Tax=Necturus beyeri TaxID=324346 RepID=C9DHF8_9SALA|nr:NADH dehydrogenase subunit 6 [Necturus beyeri]ACU00363.1 NADH dehydrogenase subunit 6 [Necturus beyeri]